MGDDRTLFPHVGVTLQLAPDVRLWPTASWRLEKASSKICSSQLTARLVRSFLVLVALIHCLALRMPSVNKRGVLECIAFRIHTWSRLNNTRLRSLHWYDPMYLPQSSEAYLTCL
jgi:hypothetical protein